MKFLIAALLTLFNLNLAMAKINLDLDVIYGEDNRLDVYQNRNPLHAQLAQSTAGMVHKNFFAKTSHPRMLNLHGLKSLEQSHNVCPSEAFAQQTIAPNCSGFLVGPDLLVTAGHCYQGRDTPENTCNKFVWVFGYDMKSEQHDPSQNISVDDVYLCKAVIASQFDKTMDFAIIRLDRRVTGRRPLKFRGRGKVSDRTPLVVIGHPSGLPTKISNGGRITQNDEPTRFATTLDTFQGNSGSAVFDATTGEVQGILIMGKTDYQPSIPGNPNSCLVVNRCDNNAQNCTAGEDDGPVERGEVVLRIESIAGQIHRALRAK
jgi:V8-like Glu-specific endopeptidase